MNQTLINSVAQNSLQARPSVRVGQTVIVHQKIKEGEKERVQRFEGLVIQVKGDKGVNQTFTVRAIVSGVGVEKIFPTHSPSIEKIEIVKQSKVRRARLYYMRERSGKSARLKEVPSDIAELNKLVDIDTIYPGVESTAPVTEETANTEAPAAESTEATPEVAEAPAAETTEAPVENTEAPVAETTPEAAEESKE